MSFDSRMQPTEPPTAPLDLYLLKDRQRLQAMLNDGEGAILVVDRAGVVHYASPPARALLSEFPEEALGQHLFSFLNRTDAYPMMLLLEHLSSDQSEPATMLLRLFVSRGRWQWFKATAATFLYDDDTPFVAVALQSLRSFDPRHTPAAAGRGAPHQA